MNGNWRRYSVQSRATVANQSNDVNVLAKEQNAIICDFGPA
jgi:hypothetical protein